MRWRILVFLIIITGVTTSRTQTYIWPTDASDYLTSSFGEFRYGHFHAGIDVKTWGKTGYPVYATRSGYIWRIKVSPYGYGRVIYQKLDTDEIVIYGHLERFVGKLERVVKQEQQKVQNFSINIYFKPYEFPVEQGEIIAYTGESGSGPAHLHFEIRDADNNPINPLAKGFPVTDTQAPVITDFAVVPLAACSEINNMLDPFITKPRIIRKNEYIIDDLLQLSGKVGFAIEAYDPLDFVSNKLGIYQINLFVDEQLIFSSQYNKFSYAHTKQIFLDRDFRLLRKGKGIFYRCFRDLSAQLPFYGSFPPGAGVIDGNRFHHAQWMPETNQDSQQKKNTPYTFRIEALDFYANKTSLSGKFIIQSKPELEPVLEIDTTGRVYLTDLSESNRQNCQQLNGFISYNAGISWKLIFQKKFSRASPLNRFKRQYITKIPHTVHSSRILKLTASDHNGLPFYPAIKILKPIEKSGTSAAFLTLKKTFYNNYINFDIRASIPVINLPQLIIKQSGHPHVQVKLFQIDLNHFRGCYELVSGKDGLTRLEISGETIDQRGIFYEEQFTIQTITRHAGGKLISTDGQLLVEFLPNSVYQTLFIRIEEELPGEDTDLNFIGQIYRILPGDVPLKNLAKIAIKYPVDTAHPEKLGIYTTYSPGNNSRWRFSGNTLDLTNHLISTHTSAFDYYALLSDDVPPIIDPIYPLPHMRFTNNQPLIKVKIYDELSGIRGDAQHMQLFLDDKLCIAEFDPEKKTLMYQVEASLSKGKHVVRITATDRSQNNTQQIIPFWIL